jgi:hypothetical protein
MAVARGEAVLRQRFCLGQGCHAVFFICTHCDRGHRYCSIPWREQARRQQRRSANRAPKDGSIIAIASARTGAACLKRNHA